MRNFLWLTFLGLILHGCFDRGDCLDVSTNKLQVTFYDYASKKTKNIKIDSVILTGPNKLIFVGGTSEVTKIELQLDYSVSSAQFHFYFSSNHYVLDADYSHRAFALGPDCQVIEVLTVDEAIGTDIRDLIIVQSNLTRSATENIRLYF